MRSCIYVIYVLCCAVLCLVTQWCPTVCDHVDCSLPDFSVQGDSPGKNIGVVCHALLQGIFPTQGSNPGLPHHRQILYHLSHQGSPSILEWVACPFSKWSSWPRNWTGVSWIEGRFFTSWATREALYHLYQTQNPCWLIPQANAFSNVMDISLWISASGIKWVIKGLYYTKNHVHVSDEGKERNACHQMRKLGYRDFCPDKKEQIEGTALEVKPSAYSQIWLLHFSCSLKVSLSGLKR